MLGGVIVHYAEIAVKGRNRPVFIRRLADNLEAALAGLPVRPVVRMSGRLWIPSTAPLDPAPLHERMQTVFGVASYAPAVRVPMSLEAIKAKALALVEGRSYATFRVSARRAFKNLPLASMDVNREVGAHLVQHRPAKVQLKGADLDLHVEMVPDGAYLYADTFPGLGGLPVGVTGKVAVLLSGGIDSPVAAWRMQRRGCRVVLVHFHSHPFVSRASQDKAMDLAAQLARYQSRVRLHLVPFGELQRDIVTTVPPPLRVVLYRRFMLRLAATLAARERARALVTGESLAQVASQTLANMVAIDEASPMTVLRPVVGFDKNEIINEAKRLGTYAISIVPDQDCCQLFVPKHPETHASLDEVKAAEATLAKDALCASALSRVETRDFQAPWYERAPEPKPRADAPAEV